MARSHPDLNLQLGAAFNGAANGVGSVEIKGFPLHMGWELSGEVCSSSCSWLLPALHFQRSPVLSQEGNSTLSFVTILPWPTPELFFFFLKNSKNCLCPLQSAENVGFQASIPL